MARARRGDGLLRRLRSSAVARRAIARAGWAWVRLCRATGRWTVEGGDLLDEVLAGGRWIVPVWHGRVMLYPVLGAPQIPAVAMISANKDGETIAAMCAMFHVGAIRGSSRDRRPGKDRDRQGAQAYAAALAHLANDHAILGMTPDGPRGPRMRCKPGIAELSIRAGAPVVPIAFATRPGPRLGSWDRFMVPMPFARCAMVLGPRVDPPADGDAEAHLAAIDAAMIAATQRADVIVGAEPVAPDPRPAA